MPVFRIMTAGGFNGLYPTRGESILDAVDSIRDLDGRASILAHWSPIKVEITRLDQDEDAPVDSTSLPTPDVAGFGSHIAVCEAAKRIFTREVGDHAVFLPFDVLNGEPFWFLHPVTALDAIDMDQSRYRCFSSGRLMCVYEYILKPRFEWPPIFRILPGMESHVFVNETLASIISERQLTGVRLSEIRVRDMA